LSEKQKTVMKLDHTAEEAAAIDALARAKRQRVQSKRVEVADQPAPRRPAPEQVVTIAKALAELAGKDASSAWVTPCPGCTIRGTTDCPGSSVTLLALAGNAQSLQITVGRK
jgi:hypothetical protein